MTDTTRFQPGDKVKAGIFVADLGLTPGRIYTVHHVDDFGLVQPETARHHHYHPSHFELVMRAVADETYCLLDGEGDWWILDEAPDAVPYWRLLADPLIYRSAFDEGVREVDRDYGIDAEPTAPAETYCLKDGDGEWWFSTDGEGFRLEWWSDHSPQDVRSIEHIDDSYGILDDGKTTLTASAGQIFWAPLPTVPAVDSCSECASYDPNTGLHWDTCPNRGSVHMGSSDAGNSTGPSLRFEAVPLQPEPGDRARIVRTSATDASHGIADGMRDVGDEFIVTEVGTNDHGPFAKGDAVYDWHPEDLEKVTDPAPLQPGDWVKVLARVEHVYDNGSIKAQTFQSDGTGNGPSIYAVASAITRTDEVPEWAQEPEMPAEPAGRFAIVAAGLFFHSRYLMGGGWTGSDGTRRTWAEVCALGTPVVHVEETE